MLSNLICYYKKIHKGNLVIWEWLFLIAVFMKSLLLVTLYPFQSKDWILFVSLSDHSSTLQWHHNERDGISNHQPHDCLLNRSFRRRSKKTPKLRVTGLYVGNTLMTGQFPAQRSNNTENVSIWWRHHEKIMICLLKWVIINYHCWQSSQRPFKLTDCKSLTWLELVCNTP